MARKPTAKRSTVFRQIPWGGSHPWWANRRDKMICKRLRFGKIHGGNGNHEDVFFQLHVGWLEGCDMTRFCFWFSNSWTYLFTSITIYIYIEILSPQIWGDLSSFLSPRTAIEDKEADVKADALRSLVKSLIAQATEMSRESTFQSNEN